MPQKRFGGAHTKLKLDKIEEYLRVFTTALKNQNFRLIYFDAFAGTGDIPQLKIGQQKTLQIDQYEPLISGSAQRALKLGENFDELIFVDKSASKISELKRLIEGYPNIENRIRVECADANTQIQKFCKDRNWNRCRAVVFLDPFGNQVEWQTIEAIASTKAIDLWYLFPAGLGVDRQIAKDGSVHETHGPSLDRMLGTTDWRSAFIEVSQQEDLFGDIDAISIKDTDPAAITNYMISRMKNVFEGGVLDQWLPLGSNNVHMYSLLFAWANPSEKAKLAGKLAKAVLRSGVHGRTI